MADTYIDIYLLTFAQPHKNNLKCFFYLKKNLIKLSEWNDRSSQWKNGNCSPRMLLKGLLKRLFKVKWYPILIPFQNDENKIILKNLEQEFMSVVKLKPNLFATYIRLFKNFGRRETSRNDYFHWTLMQHFRV